MGYRIVKQPVARKAKPQKDKGYLAWLHTLPCVITGMSPVEAAHVNTAAPAYGHDGRGKGQKAHDSFALPLDPYMHATQHKGNEMAFWAQYGINPHIYGLVLFGIYSRHKDKHEATERATLFINQQISPAATPKSGNV